METAIFRADGSTRLGLGHIMRCLALADGLRSYDLEVLFLTRDDPQVKAVIQAQGYVCETIPHGATWHEDSDLTQKAVLLSNAHMVITDICHHIALSKPDALDDYHHLLSAKVFTVCIAGGMKVDIPADIVVSPYFGVEPPIAAINDKRVFLVGLPYFIFRCEFVEAAQKPRIIRQNVHRILITIGGGDDLHLTTKVLKAFGAATNAQLELRIILGPAYSEVLKIELAALCENFDGRCTCLEHPVQMAEMMLWADMAIIGDGLTKYEAAVTGTPSLMLSLPHSEKTLNQAFVQAGTTCHVGDSSLLSIDTLAALILNVMRDYSLRSSMSRNGKAMLDGQGIARIIQHIPKGILSHD